MLHRFAIKFGSRTCGGIHSTRRLFDSVILFSHFLFSSILFCSLLSISFLSSSLILLYVILSYLMLSYLILSYLVLSYLILFSLFSFLFPLFSFLFPLSSFLFPLPRQLDRSTFIAMIETGKTAPLLVSQMLILPQTIKITMTTSPHLSSCTCTA